MIGPVGPKARLALEHSTAAIELYEGAVRSGKTITSLLSFVGSCAHGPAGEFAIVGRTERTAYRNVIRPLQDMLGRRKVAYSPGTGRATILGRTVWVYGANNEAAVSKVQGATLAGLYMDEAATLPESFFTMATTRVSIAGAKVWATMNPEGKRHWIKVNWLDHAALWVQRDGTVRESPQNTDQRIHRYTFTIDDNPYLPAEFVARLKASYSGVWYRRFILSEWTNAEGAVFDGFDEDKHVVPWKQLPRMRRLLGAGLDYGTQAASAAGALGWGEDNRLYIVDEWRHDAAAGEPVWTDAQISKGVRDWWDAQHTPHNGEPGIEWLYVDPSAASIKAQLWFDRFTRVANADNDVVPGLRLIASLFNLDRLRIADTCAGLLKELPSYTWDSKVAAKTGEDKPVKKDDHSIDGALRYPVASTQSIWAPSTIGPHAKPVAA